MTKQRNAMSSKEIRKAAHTFANLHKDDMGSMLSLALDGNEQVFSKSGIIAAAPVALTATATATQRQNAATQRATDPFRTYLTESTSKLPWNGLTAIIARDFSTCAEAHVWLELIGRGKNPKNYTLVSFNSSGIIAAPCANCAQWVEKAFGAVYKETTSHRTGQQNPFN